MEPLQVVQSIVGMLIPVILWLVNKHYTESKEERQEILRLIHELGSEQERMKERIIRLEIKFGIDDPPTNPRRNFTFQEPYPTDNK